MTEVSTLSTNLFFNLNNTITDEQNHNHNHNHNHIRPLIDINTNDFNNDQPNSKRMRFEKSGSIKFVKEIPRHLICCICCDVFDKPVIIHGCGHEFCEKCATQAIQFNKKCPLCRQEINGPESLTQLRRIKEEISHLEVYCPFTTNGCCQIIELQSLEEHKANCQFAIKPCLNYNYGCEWKGTQFQQLVHTKECEYEKVKKVMGGIQKEIERLETKNKFLESQAQKAKYTEAMFRSRANRTKQAQRNKLKISGCDVENRVVSLKVVEQGTIRFVFRLKNNVSLSLIKPKMLQQRNGQEVILTCDAPLEYGGTEILDNQTLFFLGLHEDPIIFAEFL